MAKDLWKWNARQLADAIRTCDISSREATLSALARMDAVNPAINAVVVPMHEQALTAADEADAAVARGNALGTLHGVPITIKMNVDVRSMPRTNGLKIFANRVSADDSPVVTNLRKAGAVILGLTNSPAFAARACTSNELYGETLNPWNRDVTPGGSSGGAASSVAAGIGAMAHGNDLGGSIRGPAYHCGVFGLKVTPSRIPNYNPSLAADRPPVHQSTTSQGPLARDISGIRLGYEAMSRRDARDPWWVPPMPESERVKGPQKVALFEAPAGSDAIVNANLERVAAWLGDAGYQVERVAPPRFDEAFELHTSLLHAERSGSTLLEINRVGDEFVRRTAASRTATTEPVPLLERDEFLKALAQRSTILREWLVFFEKYPLLLMPDFFFHKLEAEYDQKGDAAVGHAHWASAPHRVVSLLSLPALSAPCQVVDDAPIGVQLVASRFQEEFLMDVGELIGQRNGMGESVTPSWL